MASGSENIRDLMLKLTENDDEIFSTVGEVSDVDESARTCTITPANGTAQIIGCRLQSGIDSQSGFVMIPKEGSNAVATFLSNETAYLALMDAVDKILIDTDLVEFNGGDNGGLINIQSLVDKINAVESSINNHITVFNTHTHITTATIGPTAVVGVIAPTIPGDNTNTITPSTTVNDLEDDKIKH